jgi:hypothetical protein
MGAVLVSKNIPASPAPFLELIAPYHEDLAVAAASASGLCRAGARAVHARDPRWRTIGSNAHKIAARVRGGMMPQA